MLIGCKMLCYPSVRSPLGSWPGGAGGMSTMTVLDGPHSGSMSLRSGPHRLMGLISFRAPIPNPQLRHLDSVGKPSCASSLDSLGKPARDLSTEDLGLFGERCWTLSVYLQ